MRPIQVVLVTDFAHIVGGASKVAIGAAPYLAQAGFEVTLFAGAGEVREELTGVRVVSVGDQPFAKKGLRQGLAAGLWNPRTAAAMRDLLNELDPRRTVVHIHTHREVHSASVPAQVLAMDRPLVMTAHEYFFGCPYGAFYDEPRQALCPERGLSVGCLKRHCNQGSYLKKLFAFARQRKHAAAGIPSRVPDLVFVSDFSLARLEPYLGDFPKRHRVDNPVETPFQPTPRELSPSSPFLFVGTLHAGKDPLTFARAAAQLGVPATFIGKGDLADAIRNNYPRAEVKGWLDKEALFAEYGQARALVFGPIWPETQGLAVHEAAAFGVPAIVTETSAPSLFVTAHASGLTVPPANVDALRDALARMLDDEFARTTGTNAYHAFWQNPPTMARHVAEIGALYERIVSERRIK